MAKDIIAMIETLDRGSLRGLRDRAMLLIGFAGGLRRSEIVGLDLKADQTEDGRGWIEILDKGMLITLRGKTGWRSRGRPRFGRCDLPGRRNRDLDQVRQAGSWPPVSPGDGARKSCQVRATERQGGRSAGEKGRNGGLAVRGDLTEIERAFKFSGHSLRAGLASSAEVDERYVQKQLGHASAEMTRRYQRRRDRFRVNLTKASGL